MKQSSAAMTEPVILSDIKPEDFPKIWYDLADEHHFWCRWRMAAFRRQLQLLGIPTNNPWRGLEIGCGNGLVRRQLEGLTGWNVDGADIDIDALKRNHARRGQSYLYDIHDRNPELEEAYDFILLFDVLEHIDGPEVQKFLEASCYHLKPGGKLFLNVPAMESLRSAYDDIAGHYRRYSKTLVLSELGSAGLQVDDVRYWGCSLVLVSYLRKQMLKKLGDPDKIISHGFRPPARWINHAMDAFGCLERSVVASPPCGTSLLAVATKV